MFLEIVMLKCDVWNCNIYIMYKHLGIIDNSKYYLLDNYHCFTNNKKYKIM